MTMLEDESNGLIALDERTALTWVGRVYKGIDKIEELRAGIELRPTVRIFSWQIGRIMRRDFNLVTNKMFRRCCNRHNQKQVRELIRDMVFSAERLKSEIEHVNGYV